MSDNLHTLCAWGARFRALCELDNGFDAMTLTVDGVTLHVTADKAQLMTPVGPAELDLDAMRFAPVADAAPSSSKQQSNGVRDA